MKKIFLLALLPLSVLAATDNVLTWVPPTTYENGTALPAAEIKEYKVNVKWNGVAQPVLVATGGTNTTYTHRVNNRGTWCYTLQTVSIDNNSSVPSNEACKVVTHGNPNPPTGVTVK